MKVTLLLSVIAISIVLARSAVAGAATGMPSPFVPLYSDLGYRGQCLWHGEVSRWCPIIVKRTSAHAHVFSRAAGKSHR
jgi:hypothetical protein